MRLRSSLLVTAVVVAAFAALAVPSYADSSHYPTSWNGWWIYLSPSSQTSNDGCTYDGYKESPGQMVVAETLAYGAGCDLVARGYKVRIGTGDLGDRIGASNDLWAVTHDMRHVALHSNAPATGVPWDCTSPYDYDAANTGTDVYHWSSSSNGHALSGNIRDKLYTASPGRGAGYESSLHGSYTELGQTFAPAVIVEEGYHTFAPDVNFLKAPGTYGSTNGWAWRIGWGIDTTLGYP